MSMQAKRLRRVGDSRATVRQTLNLRDAQQWTRAHYGSAPKWSGR